MFVNDIHKRIKFIFILVIIMFILIILKVFYIQVIKYKDLVVDINKGIIKSNDREIVLTKNEMIIFSYLLSNKERIVLRDELMTTLWNNDEYINDNALTVNISRLRSKLESLGLKETIETKKKVGYKLL